MTQNNQQSTGRFAVIGRRLVLLVLVVGAVVLIIQSRQYALSVQAHQLEPVALPLLALERVDGKLFRRGEKVPFTGIMLEYHAGGVLKSRTSVVDGLLHGESEGFYTGGTRQILEHFVSGVQEGTRLTWYASGVKMSEGVMRQGKQEGTYRRWHDNGLLEVEAEFKDGKPDGLSHSWYPSGFLKAEASMVLGEVSERHLYEDGVRQQPTLLARTNIQ